MLIQFNVGRDHTSWTKDLPDAEPETLAKEIFKSGALRSKSIWLEAGKIYAGCRCVGTYHDVSEQRQISA